MNSHTQDIGHPNIAKVTREHDPRIKVLLAGFPTNNLDKQLIIDWLKDICDGNEFLLKFRNKLFFRGFAFIMFDRREEADVFCKKEYYYEDKLLDVRVADANGDHINECLENLKWPKKVFAAQVPKTA